MIFTPIANIFRSKKSKLVMVKPNSENLSEIKKMVEKENLKGRISKVFNFNDIQKAHIMSQKGGFSGKLVLKNWI